ncbi:hypothetical protein PoB_005052200 [Plakobranchus ocellatus]|uniref:Uncharacterized protein n=1 Tax=Plakobranchus ocellatus TaxID=259542 RepID=A0AAV4BYA4_9GAST|nr:hypothetical protein PoB_005052200 [Plakobranchus ocellatus]
MIQFKQGGGHGAVTLANLIGLMAVGSPLRLISLTFPDSPRISHSYYSGTRKCGAPIVRLWASVRVISGPSADETALDPVGIFLTRFQIES